MCGFIFVKYSNKSDTDISKIKYLLHSQSWRGPDAEQLIYLDDCSVIMGHNRLSIIDTSKQSNQPMRSNDGRYWIVFNGEIYNFNEVKKKLALTTQTNSDTEVILEGYIKVGKAIVNYLDGMYAFVIYDTLSGTCFSARDEFGIKPLFYGNSVGVSVIGSEAAVLARLLNDGIDTESIEEWKVLRRPIPGRTFFKRIHEHLPGCYKDDINSDLKKYWQFSKTHDQYNQYEFQNLLFESVKKHQISDVENVSLLSGGLDSAIITKISDVKNCYTVGLINNNEAEGAYESAINAGKKLNTLIISEDRLIENWKYLTVLRGEPLSVPNEALIYELCRVMKPSEKVLLTGEGADELLFGYDQIFRWAINNKESKFNLDKFLLMYGYSNEPTNTNRFKDYIDNLLYGKNLIEFMEDFFYQFHLPGLLRRMDFASMAASKEARVPYVTKNLINYMYRQDSKYKIDNINSKIPLRNFGVELGLSGAVNRKKIGFSASNVINSNKYSDYKNFQKIIMESLGW